MESVVGQLAVALSRRGHQVEVVTLDRAITDGSVLPTGPIDGVGYTRLRRVGPRRYPAALGLVKACTGAEVVHVHGLDGLADLLVRTRRRHGARVGVSTHGGYLHTRRHRWAKALWMRTMTRSTLARADAVWFTSEADRVALAPARADGPVIADAVDLARFEGVTRVPDPDTWVVVGRVDVHKGIDDLIATIARMRRPPARLRVLGAETAPGLVGRLQHQASALGVRGVVFEGECDESEMVNALATCGLAVFPSRYESFGVAALEAMAAGAPVVASDIPAHRLLLGGCGQVVDFDDPSAAAVALDAVDPVALSAGCRDRAAHFGLDDRVVEWERAYRGLVR